MNIILEKNQLERLNEVIYNYANLSDDPLSEIFDYLLLTYSENELVNYFKTFYKNELGENVKNIPHEDIIGFFRKVSFGKKDFTLKNFKKRFSSKSNLLPFVHFILTSSNKVKKGVGVNYIVSKEKGFNTKKYLFFEPTFKFYIGRISTEKKIGGLEKISLSGVDPELIGMGYGFSMYATIIKNVEYLASDQLLYMGSMKMWSEVLPKVFNVWGVKSESYFDKLLDKETKRTFKKITSRTIDVDKFDYFIASSKHSKPNEWLK